MMILVKWFMFGLTLCSGLFAAAQGPYAPPAGQSGTTAIHKDSSAFMGWATGIEVVRGLQDIAEPDSGYASSGVPDAGTGYPDGSVVSLGDSGYATLTFYEPVYNGAGYDFAIFENSFSDDFLELAFVEVSSDGINFFRFNSVSLTDTSTQVESFGTLDATNLYNLAGKYRAQYGVPFDLEELNGTAGLNVDSITHIRVVDVIGSINEVHASHDSQGNKVNDPYPTRFGPGGFDLDAVGLIHTYGVNAIENPKERANISLYPNPLSKSKQLSVKLNSNGNYQLLLVDLNGRIVYNKNLKRSFSKKVDLSGLKKGVYQVIVDVESGERFTEKLVILH